MAKPLDKNLYDMIKREANQVFKAPTGIYRSMWISREYKKRGGLYEPKKGESKVQRWLDEKWVNLNDPIIRNNQIIGYNKCGSKNIQNNLYPLCRPSLKISSDTPIIYQEISKNRLKKANQQKQKVRNRGNVKF